MIVLPILTTSPTHTFLFKKVGRMSFLNLGVKGLTQISVYNMPKNVSVGKIMGAMHTAYAKGGTHMFQTTHEANDRGRHTAQ